MGLMSTLPSTRANTIRAMLLVLVGSAGMQFSAVLALGLFPELGVLGTSATRMAIAAIFLLAIFRPRLRGRTGREWAGIVLYGVAMAAMNAFLFLAVDRLPLGIATTIDFLGPCAVALAASRRIREGLLALVALGGVVLIAGFGGPLDPLGVLFAALAGAGFGLYTLLAARIGQSEGGLPSIALSVAVAAILTLPFSAPTVPHIRVEHLLPLVASALLGTALAFSVDTLAGRFTTARVLGVFFAFDPALGTIVGALVLGQVLTPAAFLGVLLVVVAGAGIVWLAGRRSEPGPRTYAGPVAQQTGIESEEVERKYEVREGAALPGAEAFAAIGLSAEAPEVHHLVASYFDTPDRALAAQGLAVRSRAGGKDAGWHLKRRGADGVHETGWPPSPEMPEALAAEIRDRIGEEGLARLRAVAELRTTRTVVVLRDREPGSGSGAESGGLIEIADDEVFAIDRQAESAADEVRRAWREWEAEMLGGADRAWLDRLEPVLLAAGASPSPSIAKIARATGQLAGLARAKGADAALVSELAELERADQARARRLDS